MYLKITCVLHGRINVAISDYANKSIHFGQILSDILEFDLDHNYIYTFQIPYNRYISKYNPIYRIL